MVAILTGDIIKSRERNPSLWIDALKQTLQLFGTTPNHWEVYRGDSFQLEVSPEKALFAAFLIKASLKHHSNLDVRIAIGIGEKTYESDNITESNGNAFINSGTCFENLKKNTLAIKTEDTHIDETLNLMFELVSFTIQNWTPVTAELIAYTLQHPQQNQKKLAKHFKITQGNVSQSLKRGGYDEISKLLSYYESQIQTLC